MLLHTSDIMISKLKRIIAFIFAFIILTSVLIPNTLKSEAATVTKNTKTYEIAVVFDNSGSMYDNQSWCRAKYAMEIFSSMLHYENKDTLTVFPMWEVTTDNTKPESGGSIEGIKIQSSKDIEKINNLYTVSPSNTPFAPVTEAYKKLKSSQANEKWLIVLTDGEFNENERGRKANIDLQSNLLKMASEEIKVQYLGIGKAISLQSDESKFFYTKKSSETSLKEDLINICNNIFQRSILPAKYINGSELNLDLSMKSLIIFAQGSNSTIQGLKDKNNKDIKKILDSGQIKYSTVSAGGKYVSAPIDNTLAGQVVTFDKCPKGKYKLSYSGTDTIQIFYEPDVDINISLLNSDNQEVDCKSGKINAGDYKLNYGLTDALSGEDVTKSELMGNEVNLKAVLKTSDGTETPLTNGDTVSFKPDASSRIIVSGTYLKDYKITTEDDPTSFPPLKVTFPEIGKFKIKAETEQTGAWFQLGKEKSWKPIKLLLTLNGVPLTEEQMKSVELKMDITDNIIHSYKMIPEESAFEVYIGYDNEKNFLEPKCKKYTLNAKAKYTDKNAQTVDDQTKMKFDINRFPLFFRWLKWIIILIVLITLLTIILTRKAWPNSMELFCKATNDIDIMEEMNLASNSNPGLLPTTAKKNSKLYLKWSKRANVKITEVRPKYDVTYFQIGNSVPYTKCTGGFKDPSGKPFKPTIIRNNTRILIGRQGRQPLDGKIIINGRK